MKSVGVEWLTGYGNTMVDLSTVNATDNVVGEIDKIFDQKSSKIRLDLNTNFSKQFRKCRN